MLRWCTAAFFGLPLALAIGQTPGSTINVKAAAKPDQSYVIYLPSAYHVDRSWPILYVFDPGARGALAAQRFERAAERFGWIVAASNNSRNGSWQRSLDAMQAMWDDTHARLRIDDLRVYGAGFSGGARVASQVGILSRAFAGVILCGAGFAGDVPEQVPFAVFGAAGTDDFNNPELRHLDRTLATRHIPHRLDVFDGGHEWPPDSVVLHAFEWLELVAIRSGTRPRDPSLVAMWLAARRQTLPGDNREGCQLAGELAEDFEGLADVTELKGRAADCGRTREFRRWIDEERSEDARQKRVESDFARLSADFSAPEFRSLATDLRKQAAASSDSVRRRVARRVLQGAMIGAMETGRQLLAEKKFADAIRQYELAAAIRPDRPGVRIELARACLHGGDRKRALAEIRKAITEGYSDRSAFAADPDFTPVGPEIELLFRNASPAGSDERR